LFTPLIIEHDIVNLPSASTLAVIRREAPLREIPDKTIAVFADPVFQATDAPECGVFHPRNPLLLEALIKDTAFQAPERRLGGR
jgi:hypothetical protein